MNIDFFSYSGRGGRPINEDSLLCRENYFIVSDGLGGHNNGEIASSAAVDYISLNYRSDISENAISELLIGADNAVRRTGQGGKATLAALFTDGDKIRISNIGDSRVYYFRSGRIFFRTKDHSVCQASVDMGEMTDSDVRNSEDRSGLFKVLGDNEPLKPPKTYDIIDPLNNDAFLICSDGFWEHVYEMEMEADLLKSENPNQWLIHMLKRLLLRSANGGDNFTAICGIISAPEKAPAPLPMTMPMTSGEIPPTMELTVSKKTKKPRKLIPILICAAVILAAAIAAAISLPKLMTDNKDDPEKSDLYSSFEAPKQTEKTEESEAPENTEETKEPKASEDTEETEEPEETEESEEPTDTETQPPPIYI